MAAVTSAMSAVRRGTESGCSLWCYMPETKVRINSYKTKHC